MTELNRAALLFVALAPLSSALAAPTVRSCDTGEAPTAYDDEACHSTCTAIAWGFGLYDIECDINVGSSTVDGEIYAVYDYPDIADINFSAWGTRKDGTAFCCYVDDSGNSVWQFYIYGSSRADTIAFQESGGESMEDPSTGYFLAEAHGRGGDDVITGSDETEANFHDYLLGNEDDDELWGGTGADTIEGNQGDDELRGEGGDDTLRGGAGDDSLYGAAGNNVLCGGGGSSTGDYFQALTGANQFWEPWSGTAPAPSGSVGGILSTCGAAAWGSSWAGASCTYSLTAAPSGC